MIRRPSAKKTKSQILDIFDELLAEHKALTAQHEQLRKERASHRADADPSNYTMETIFAELSMLRHGFGAATSELSTKLTSEVSTLQELRNQIDEKNSHLVELYGLEIEEGTLDQLILEYNEKSTEFAEELKQEREAFEEEQSEQKQAWYKEQDEHARLVKERNETVAKLRTRGNEEYRYNLELQQKLSTEQYNQQMQALHRELDELVEAREKEWAEREKAITEREETYQKAKEKAESLPEELEEAIEKAKKAGEEISRRQTSFAANLLAKEEEGNTQVSEYKIQSLEETIKRQRARIESLSTQLELAVQQAQDLAMKSIEGSAHETSFNALKEIVLEQAKHSTKGK